MGLKELKKELNRMDKTEIIKMVSEMYKTIPLAKNYLDVFTNGEIDGIVEKYEKEIENYIYPSGANMIMREAEARKLIRVIRKLKITELTIQLELHYVKCCIEVIKDLGYWDENYYMAIDRMFYSATDKITHNGLEDKYKPELSFLISESYEYGLDFEF